MTEEALLTELRAINDRVTELCGALKERCPEHARRLLDLESMIGGLASNVGGPGFKARMLVLETTVATINDRYGDAMAAVQNEYVKASAYARRMLWAVLIGPTGMLALFGAVIYFLIDKK